MTIGHVTFQPAHLSDAGYYQDQASECEERAYRSQLTDVQALYRNLAAHWRELARNANRQRNALPPLLKAGWCFFPTKSRGLDRPFLKRRAPSLPWHEHPPRYGRRVSTLEEAKAQFKKSWDAWKARCLARVA